MRMSFSVFCHGADDIRCCFGWVGVLGAQYVRLAEFEDTNELPGKNLGLVMKSGRRYSADARNDMVSLLLAK
jgi:hypothetical protein